MPKSVPRDQESNNDLDNLLFLRYVCTVQYRTTAQGLLETMMQPEYLAILRLILAELPRFPELGTLFRQTVPEQGFNYFLTLLRSGQRNGVVQEHIDPPTVARMFLGTVLTYALLDGL